MEALTRSLIDGDLVIKILILQAAVVVLVMFFMKRLLDRELFVCALEKIAHVPPDQGLDVDQVVVVAARKLSAEDNFRLRTVIKVKFPQAEIIVGEDRSLGGGVVVRAGGHVFDLSVWTKIRQLFNLSDT